MNDKHFNSILLAAILVTAFLVAGVHFLPDKRLVIVPYGGKPIYLQTEQVGDGIISSEWTNGDHTAWKCNYVENFPRNYFPCSWTVDLSHSISNGMDLSRYEDLILHLNYSGPANKVRVAIRNFNPAYSTLSDRNSTKYNAIQLHTKELNKENRISLSAFAAADWWLQRYNIPLSDASAEVSNATSIVIDFGEPEKAGTHLFFVEKLELRGEWIKVEHWYLLILCVWMLGILIYSVKRLIELNAQTRHDIEVITQLSTTNEKLKEETDKFRRLSTVDPLTQLYNRFGIDQIIASLAGKGYLSASDNPRYSLLVADIDYFKRINDQYGHDTGDQVLQHVAKIIQENMRGGDFVGRWGGEEFVMIMPGANAKNAMTMAEMIREAVASTVFPLEEGITLSASFGVSERLPNEDFATCFKRADNALYKAKQQGRNRCVAAGETL